jgi:hypothetical protein
VFPALVLWYIWQEPLTAPGFALGPAAMLYLIATGRWDLTSYALRFVSLAGLLVVTWHQATWLPAVVVAVWLASVLLLRRPGSGEIIDLQFPLRDGAYYIVHGGASPSLNGHSASESQQFALDIVRLNRWGRRARGVYPAKADEYEIFGRPVYSPCNGIVSASVGDLEDEPPGRMNRRNLAGNFVSIRMTGSDNVCVALAHLARGSVAVQTGERVAAGQLLGRVGNSGNSSEPHLHIHAKRGGDAASILDGAGVRLRFGGRWLIRNSVVRAR